MHVCGKRSWGDSALHEVSMSTDNVSAGPMTTTTHFGAPTRRITANETGHRLRRCLISAAALAFSIAVGLSSLPASAGEADQELTPDATMDAGVWCAVDAGSLNLGPEMCETTTQSTETLEWPNSVP